MLNYAELGNFMQVMLKTYAKVGFGPYYMVHYMHYMLYYIQQHYILCSIT